MDRIVTPIVLFYKKPSWTPLQAIELFKKEHPQYKDSVIGYAGRLDPMAEGLLMLLIDDENKKREHYSALDKEYDVEIVFGIGTDSYDGMGIIEETKIEGDLADENGNLKESIRELTEYGLREVLKKFTGRIQQKLPAFSSAPVDGKPLYYWAHHGLIHTIEIPTVEREIFSINLISLSCLSFMEVYESVVSRVKQVSGDFRQEAIIASWDKLKESLGGSVGEGRNVVEEGGAAKVAGTAKVGAGPKQLLVAKIHVDCSSGTYMRALAYEIGKAVGMPAIAYTIKRTKIGDFGLEKGTHMREEA